MRRGDIVEVLLPQRQTEGAEQFGHPARPLLVVSVPGVHANGRGFIGCPITKTARHAPEEWHVEITPGDVNTRGNERGLTESGIILAEQLRYTSFARLTPDPISACRGRVSVSTMAKVERALAIALGIPA